MPTWDDVLALVEQKFPHWLSGEDGPPRRGPQPVAQDATASPAGAGPLGPRPRRPDVIRAAPKNVAMDFLGEHAPGVYDAVRGAQRALRPVPGANPITAASHVLGLNEPLSLLDAPAHGAQAAVGLFAHGGDAGREAARVIEHGGDVLSIGRAAKEAKPLELHLDGNNFRATRDGRQVAVGMLENTAEGKPYVNMLLVPSDLRRQGIGLGVMQALEAKGTPLTRSPGLHTPEGKALEAKFFSSRGPSPETLRAARAEADRVAALPIPHEKQRAAARRTAGVTFDPVPGDQFHAALTAAGKEQKGGVQLSSMLTPYTPGEYAGMRTFLSPDGKTGYAIKPDGDLVSVFNAGAHGAGADAVRHAIGNGARTLDAFDDFLPGYYRQFGFEPTATYANWEMGGTPVTYMEHRGGAPVGEYPDYQRPPLGFDTDREDAFRGITPEQIAAVAPSVPVGGAGGDNVGLFGAGEPERIQAAAVRTPDGRVFTGVNHGDAMDRATQEAGDFFGGSDGFVTSSGRFVDRLEAEDLARTARQLRAEPGLGGLGTEHLNPSNAAGAPIRLADTAPDLGPEMNSRREELQRLLHRYTQRPDNAAPAAEYGTAKFLSKQDGMNPSFSRRVAATYDAAKSQPDDPAVQAAYRQFAKELEDQYNFVTGDMGIRMVPTVDDPYKNSTEAMRDILGKGELRVFQSADGEHPLLSGDENTKFRFVHDVLGHGLFGNTFGPRGEENAFRAHAEVFSPHARGALATETRGQNSWVNYGPFGEANRADPANTRFADQKVLLLPDAMTAPNPTGPLTEPTYNGRDPLFSINPPPRGRFTGQPIGLKFGPFRPRDGEDIVASAVVTPQGRIFAGSHHGDAYARMEDAGEAGPASPGYYLTNHGRLIPKEKASLFSTPGQAVSRSVTDPLTPADLDALTAWMNQPKIPPQGYASDNVGLFFR